MYSMYSMCSLNKVTIDYRIQEQQQRNANGEAGMFGFMPFPIHRDPDSQSTANKRKQE